MLDCLRCVIPTIFMDTNRSSLAKIFAKSVRLPFWSLLDVFALARILVDLIEWISSQGYVSYITEASIWSNMDEENQWLIWWTASHTARHGNTLNRAIEPKHPVVIVVVSTKNLFQTRHAHRCQVLKYHGGQNSVFEKIQRDTDGAKQFC